MTINSVRLSVNSPSPTPSSSGKPKFSPLQPVTVIFEQKCSVHQCVRVKCVSASQEKCVQCLVRIGGPGRTAVPRPCLRPDSSPGWMSRGPRGPPEPARQPQPTCRLRQQKVFPGNLPATPKKIQEKTCKNVVLGSSMALSLSLVRSPARSVSLAVGWGGPFASVCVLCCGVSPPPTYTPCEDSYRRLWKWKSFVNIGLCVRSPRCSKDWHAVHQVWELRTAQS